MDDTYRADNRYGPKPSYTKSLADASGVCTITSSGQPIGTTILASDTLPQSKTGDDLIRDDPPTGGDPEDIGLDGYWERRARREGMRVIVGQRLELAQPLSNYNVIPAGFLGVGRDNETRQRRFERDNLAAVQGTAIYHYKDPTDTSRGYYPLACLSTTVHPGTAWTLANSSFFLSCSQHHRHRR
ncbi:hypothetical protein DO97_04435 [Neosynechococcus sphagnicola sy1]|uniref:Uncharacterized protein n=1 Tax=Neosynechococcus sphagnicola sy1 TaxID=1497020 RepID=A0A098TKX3_9CYAN|nr:hypothetical protein [Neosynechococcus sphagnicola]KGF72939.1 hypothetical protein DO97_04435 [Neosynechococcus sphagnicola sy1]